MPTESAQRIKPAANATSVRLGPQSRSLSLKLAGDATSPLDTDARTLAMSFCSQEPVARWFGDEVLSMKAGAFDFSRLNDGANLLFNHNWDDVIGVVEKAWGDGTKGNCIVRFAKTPRADEVMGMVADGILRNVSFAYEVRSYSADEIDPADADDTTYTATDWMAYEISIVTVPADASVGIGRAATVTEKDVRIERMQSQKSITPAVLPPTESADADNTKGITMPALNVAADQAAEILAAQERARKDERVRSNEIAALCQRFKMPEDFTRNLLNNGASLEQAQRDVLSNLPSQAPAARDAGDIDLTAKEKAGWSLIRSINAVLNQDWSKAGFERECSVEIAKRAGREQRNGSFFMPSRIPFKVAGAEERAIYQVGTAVQGGNLVATQLLAQSFIEVLRNATVTGQLGATYLTGLVGKVDIPRQSSATQTYWVAESGAVTEAEATFDKVSLSPKTIGSLSKISRLALLQTTPDIEMLARRDLLAVMALGLDLAALSGSGAGNQPLGVVGQSGVGSVIGGANGASLTFDHIIALKYAVKVANAAQANLGFAINSKSIGYLSTLKASTGQYLWEPQGGLTTASPDKLKGSPYAESQQLRSTLVKGASGAICSEVIYGNWGELLIGEWGVMEVMVNPYDTAGFANGDVILRALQTVDVQCRHGASFSVMSDALTPGF